MFRLKCIYLAFLIAASAKQNFVAAQDLKVINDAQVYREQVLLDSNYKMVELKTFIPGVVYDLRYATKKNFTHHQLYKQSNLTYLRLPAAKALMEVQAELAQKGLSIKVWDAYRPYAVTKKMWALIHDDRYVADPAKGSGHNRGLAVDLTLIDVTTGTELPMGTPFDSFTDTAHQTFTALPEVVLQNRLLLKTIMQRHGFTPLDTEWWHYSWKNDRNYDVLDLDFKVFTKQRF